MQGRPFHLAVWNVSKNIHKQEKKKERMKDNKNKSKKVIKIERNKILKKCKINREKKYNDE